MAPFIPLMGATIALLGAVALLALGTAIIMLRTKSNSLFVEDRMGFVVARLVLAAILIAIGFGFACSAIGRLLTLA